VTSKRYGQSFIDSLPPMPQTRDAEEVQYFLTHRDQQQELQQVSA
jgi:hypothetical protein